MTRKQTVVWRVEEGFKVIIASGQAVTIGRRAGGRP